MARTVTFATLAFAVLRCTSALNVYINAETPSSSLSPQGASFTLSRHLGLEAFEPDSSAAGHQQNDDGDFIGRNWQRAALLIMDEKDAEAALPPSSSPFYVSSPHDIPEGALDSVISTYKHRAQHAYASVYSDEIIPQVTDIGHIVDFFSFSENPSFAALELKHLADVRKQYGVSSEEYSEAVKETQSFIQSAFNDDNFHVAIITYSPSHFQTQFKREAARDQSPVPMVLSGTTCFSSASACQNSTNSCSGRGECREAKRAGKTCYVCACSATKTGSGSKTKTENWVGDSCERKDVSGPFVLLTGTAVVLVLLIVGSVSLLSAVGSVELPSTLLATAVPAKRE